MLFICVNDCKNQIFLFFYIPSFLLRPLKIAFTFIIVYVFLLEHIKSQH